MTASSTKTRFVQKKIKVFKASIIPQMKSKKAPFIRGQYRSGKIDGMEYISLIVTLSQM